MKAAAVLCSVLLVLAGVALPAVAAPGAGGPAPASAGGHAAGAATPVVATGPVDTLSALWPGKVSVTPDAPLLRVTLGSVESLLHRAGGVAPGGLLEWVPWRSVPLLAGYTRHADEPLEHDTRAALYEAVAADPGIHLSGASDVADVPRSTARYHVRVLADEGLVDSVSVDGRNRLFPADSDGRDRALAAALRRDGTAPVLRAVRAAEPATVTTLADRVDRAPSTVSYHLSRLADDDLVRKVREGGATRVTLANDVREALSPTVADPEGDAAETADAEAATSPLAEAPVEGD